MSLSICMSTEGASGLAKCWKGNEDEDQALRALRASTEKARMFTRMKHEVVCEQDNVGDKTTKRYG